MIHQMTLKTNFVSTKTFLYNQVQQLLAYI